MGTGNVSGTCPRFAVQAAEPERENISQSRKDRKGKAENSLILPTSSAGSILTCGRWSVTYYKI